MGADEQDRRLARRPRLKRASLKPNLILFSMPVMSSSPANDYHVKDIALAEWGRKEIAIAEHEMPGLLAVRKKFGH